MFLFNALRGMRPRAVHSRGGSRHPHSRRSRGRPLVLEALEGRCLLSSYSFTLLADDGPGSPFAFPAGPGGPSLGDQGTAAFHAALKSGGEGVFTRDTGGSLGIIAVTSDLVSAFPLGGGVNRAGTVSFGADLRAGGQAIFTGSGGPLSRIADTTSPDTPFSSILPRAANINDEGTVSFRATLTSGGTGIFTGRAGQPPSILYVTGGRFADLLGQIIQRNGNEVSFGATLGTGETGLFVGDGLTTTTIATTGDTYSALAAGPANDAGTEAFLATLRAGGQAIVTGDGTHLTTIADTSGPYSSFFGSTIVNDDGQVVFSANLAAGGSGIFIARDGAVDEIIGTGDALFGSTVTSFATVPVAPPGFNDLGQLAFAAHLADGRSVLVRADPCTVSLAPSESSPGLVGEPITWTATATNCGEAPVYQFSVGAAGGNLHVVRDFSPSNSFTWAPMQEGDYDVRVTVKEGYQAVQTTSAVVDYGVNSRVTGSQAVITPTSNPLVALFSVPPGPSGTVHVEFSVTGDHPDWRSTNEVPRVPGKSTNFFAAGLLPDTTYQMRYVVTGHHHHHSSPLLFTTGSLPATLTFPPFIVQQPPGPGSDLDQDMVLHLINATTVGAANTVATDLEGHVVWYFDNLHSGLGLTDSIVGCSLVPGGSLLLLGRDGYATNGNQNVLREIDLAGDPLRETNLAAVNAQLTALGHDVIYGFHHDAQRLPNGQTVVLGSTKRTVDINGTPTVYRGDMIVVLDENLQVAWAWDAFDHLDVNRGPVLGEICHPGDPGCEDLGTDYVDWTHSNAVGWSPADGNLTLSVRHQDWVIKIDYRNGAGDGHIIWRLGTDGDFTADSTDPHPWFSHQHDARYVDDTTLVLFDNGNTRRAGDPTADSRGQVWTLDEETMTATPVLNADLGVYSGALGAAERLPNGNYHFLAGRLGPPQSFFGQSIEVLPDGTQVYVLEKDGGAEYRSSRMRTLYEGTDPLLDDGATTVAAEGFNGDGFGYPAPAGYGVAPVGAPRDRAGWPAYPGNGPAASPAAAGAVDHFWAAGEGAGLGLSLYRHRPLRWADDEWAGWLATDALPEVWPLAPVPEG
jgi:hypothetical protein